MTDHIVFLETGGEVVDEDFAGVGDPTEVSVDGEELWENGDTVRVVTGFEGGAEVLFRKGD